MNNFDPVAATHHRARVNPEMIVLARGARDMSQKELADSVSISPGKLSKYESGLLSVSQSDLDQICAVVRRPPEFFMQWDSVFGFGSCCHYHRKRQSLPIRQLKAIHDRSNIMRMQVERLLRGVEIKCESKFHRMDIDEYDGSPETIAQLVRASWRLPLGPVRSIVAAIESAGGIVIQCSFGTPKIDAVSQWPRNMPPLFFINRDIPVDRWRFTLAHEIGHIVMHNVPTPEAESEADRFASEFLMPEAMIAEELDDMTVAKAARLKPYWRVSIQALIRRAKDLGRITPRKYASLCAYVSKLGYRKREPSPLSDEQPSVMRSLIDVHLNEHKYDVAQLSKVLFCDEPEFRQEFLGEGVPRLRLMP